MISYDDSINTKPALQKERKKCRKSEMAKILVSFFHDRKFRVPPKPFETMIRPTKKKKKTPKKPKEPAHIHIPNFHSQYHNPLIHMQRVSVKAYIDEAGSCTREFNQGERNFQKTKKIKNPKPKLNPKDDNKKKKKKKRPLT